MVLHHEGVEYHFDYQFAPNDGTEKVPTITVIDGQRLDGEIFITEIYVGEKSRPVTVEVLALLKAAAAREELRQNRLAWQRVLNRAAECRRAQISLVPRRG